jgi:hypothetical protein
MVTKNESIKNNNGNGKREQRAQKIIKAIHESKGLLTLAASKAGCSYWTVWKYAKDFPSVAQAIEESKEGLLDLAEGKLYQAISSGNMTAIIFYLKTRGKERGYIERLEQEHYGKGGEPIKHNVEININGDNLEQALGILSDSGAIRLGKP